ncbi:MAG: kinase [Caulobacterales bacterium]
MKAREEHDTAVASLIAAHIATELRARSARPLVFGVAGAQGSGKSTACAQAAATLEQQSHRTLTLALDDYYLSRAARAALAKDIHPLFATRGPPGTHDLAALNATLTALRTGQSCVLRAFDKLQDDVLPEDAWPSAAANPAVILFEGWCVGARSEAPNALTKPINSLERDEDETCLWRSAVNSALAGPYANLFASLDGLILLLAPSFDVVHHWRCEQEETNAMRATAPEGSQPHRMDAAAIARFIQHYERITRNIITEMPDRADLTIQLDAKRNVLGLLTKD